MLARLMADARSRVTASRQARPLGELERLAAWVTAPIDLAERLRRPGIQLVAEIKRRSPSRGALRPDLDPAALATAYADGGAAALSVLTEPDHFGGALCDLLVARAALRLAGYSLPVLRKDFVVDPYQVVEARAYGADAILLIVAALMPDELAALYGEAGRWGLSVLMEVHDEAELERALAVGPRIVGINSRNLRDMTVDLGVVARLRPRVPPGTLIVAESGIHRAADVQALSRLGIDGILVGEALVCAPCPAEAARQLVEAGRWP